MWWVGRLRGLLWVWGLWKAWIMVPGECLPGVDQSKWITNGVPEMSGDHPFSLQAATENLKPSVLSYLSICFWNPLFSPLPHSTVAQRVWAWPMCSLLYWGIKCSTLRRQGNQGFYRSAEISLQVCQFMHFLTGVRKGGWRFQRHLIGVPVCLFLIAQKCSEKENCEWEIK